MPDVLFSLQCCGTQHRLSIDLERVRAGWPDELRKNVVCPKCDKIVIVSFGHHGTDVKVHDQEVIDWA